MIDALPPHKKSIFQFPMINGVSPSQVFLPSLSKNPSSIFEFLCEHFPHIPSQEWRQRFHDQLILNSEGKAIHINSPYTPLQHIHYYRFLAHEVHVPFKEKILFENDQYMVVDKPHFLTMSPTGQYVQETLLVRLKQLTQNPDLTPIHRLDRETAGVVLISKCTETRGIYQQMFAERQVRKIYEAIAPYNSNLHFPQHVRLNMKKGEPFFKMDVVDGVPNSETEIELIQHNHEWGHYRLKPLTGKQHQLRVHLNYLDLPIKNDPIYPVIKPKPADDFSAPLQLLAKEIYFKDPLNSKLMHFCSDQILTL